MSAPENCPECQLKNFEFSDDGNRTCMCLECGHFVWDHFNKSDNACYCDFCSGVYSEDEGDFEQPTI